MKPNEGTPERLVRVVLGLVALALAFTMLDVLSGSVAGVIAAALGAVLVVTGAIGFCPAYRLVGVSTCPTPRDRTDET